MPPKKSACTTFEIESAMKPAWSSAMSMLTAGYSVASSSMTLRTDSDTVTVLAPDSLKTSRPTDSAPAYRAIDSRSAKPSTTRPTSLNRTTRTPVAIVWRAMTTSPISGTVWNSPSVRSG